MKIIISLRYLLSVRRFMLDVNRGEVVELREPPEKLGIFRRSAIC